MLLSVRQKLCGCNIEKLEPSSVELATGGSCVWSLHNVTFSPPKHFPLPCTDLKKEGKNMKHQTIQYQTILYG